MKFEVQHPGFKTQRLTVETVGWFGEARLLVNGALVQKQKGKYTVRSDSGAETSIQLQYNYLDPAIPKLRMGTEFVELASPLKWYEYLWIGVPLLLFFAGGAIGALVGLIAANANSIIFRSSRGGLAKYGLSALVTLGAVVSYVVLATLLRLLLNELSR